MDHNPVLTGATLTVTQRPAGAPAASTVTVRLTSRVFKALRVQLAAAEDVEATDGTHVLAVQRIPLRSLAEPVRVQVDRSCPAENRGADLHFTLDLTIDDGDPAGPYTVTKSLGEMPSGTGERTLVTTLGPDALNRS